MMRFFDKTVLLVGAGLLVLLIGFQTYALFGRRSVIRRTLLSAKDLVERADENALPPLERDAAAYSGAVFKKWDDVPFAEAFNAWDFYPDLPLRSR